MIKRLRKRFIRIAMAAVTSVMVLLCLIVNVANYISVDGELTQMLNIICENEGRIPPLKPNEKPWENRDGQFTPETPYSTRYFVLRYTDSGTLTKAYLDNIAAVDEQNVNEYLQVALKQGEGYGYFSGYKYYVVHNGEDRFMAIFLDSYSEIRNVVVTAVFSLIAIAVCIVLVYVIVVLCSHRAIDPVVKASQKQKQFITDASHELKTPITVIATSLKVLEMENGKQKWIDKAKAQTEKLTELVNSMVTLSKMDEEEHLLRTENFSASDAMKEIAESFYDFALSKGHELHIDIEENTEYCGDEYAVRQLASILLDNAVKYALPDSPVYFSVKKHKKGITVRTSNMCDNVSAEDTDKLFDRFYRADKSRNSSAGGFGIGLSVAYGIVQEHKGSIRAELKEHNIIEFIAELK